MDTVLVVERGWYSNKSVIAVYPNTEEGKAQADALASKICESYDPDDPYNPEYQDANYCHVMEYPIGYPIDVRSQRVVKVTFKMVTDFVVNRWEKDYYLPKSITDFEQLVTPEVKDVDWTEFEVSDVKPKWEGKYYSTMVLPNGIRLYLNMFDRLFMINASEDPLKVAADTWTEYLHEFHELHDNRLYTIHNIQEVFELPSGSRVFHVFADDKKGE